MLADLPGAEGGGKGRYRREQEEGNEKDQPAHVQVKLAGEKSQHGGCTAAGPTADSGADERAERAQNGEQREGQVEMAAEDEQATAPAAPGEAETDGYVGVIPDFTSEPPPIPPILIQSAAKTAGK